MFPFYLYTFADGYSCCVRGFSVQEIQVMEHKHGKLIFKEKEQEYVRRNYGR